MNAETRVAFWLDAGAPPGALKTEGSTLVADIAAILLRAEGLQPPVKGGPQNLAREGEGEAVVRASPNPSGEPEQ